MRLNNNSWIDQKPLNWVVSKCLTRSLRVRTGASQRRLPRIDEAEIERVIEQMRTETDNGHRAGRGVQRKSVCPKSAKVIVMDYSNGKTRHAGMSRTQTPGAKELNDLLEQ